MLFPTFPLCISYFVNGVVYNFRTLCIFYSDFLNFLPTILSPFLIAFSYHILYVSWLWQFFTLFFGNNFYAFIGTKLLTIARKQNLNGLRKCSREWHFCSLFYTSKEEAEGGYMKSIGDRLKGQGWIKSKMNRHILLLRRWV